MSGLGAADIHSGKRALLVVCLGDSLIHGSTDVVCISTHRICIVALLATGISTDYLGDGDWGVSQVSGFYIYLKEGQARRQGTI